MVEGDELVGINNKSVVGKDVKEILTLIDTIPCDESLLMRFRAACVQNYQGTVGPPAYAALPQSTTPAPFQPNFNNNNGGNIDSPEHSVEEYASELRRSFCRRWRNETPRVLTARTMWFMQGQCPCMGLETAGACQSSF